MYLDDRSKIKLHRSMTRAIATTLLLSLAQLAAAAKVEPLTGDEIRQLIVGNTLEGPYRASLYSFSYAPNGDIYGLDDHGQWKILDDDRYCHLWSVKFGGVERCYRWYEKGNGRYTMRNVDAFRVDNLEVWRIRPGMD